MQKGYWVNRINKVFLMYAEWNIANAERKIKSQLVQSVIVKFILRRYCTFYFTLRNVLVSNRISLSVEVARWIIVYSEAVYCVIINENEFYFNFQLIIKISFYTKIHCTKCVSQSTERVGMVLHIWKKPFFYF